MSCASFGRLPWVWSESVALDPPVVLRESGGVRTATRAVVTSAEPEMLFLWLCQLRRAPYSYDWIDNFGRRSPRTANPALRELAIGQRFMTIFTLTDYDSDRSLTLRMRPGWPTRAFGAITVRYQVDPLPDDALRLSAVLWMPRNGRWLGGARRYLLAWGDLVMMRKQLRVLAGLAERDTVTRSHGAGVGVRGG